MTPRKTVDVNVWVAGGVLDVWVREHEQWYVRVRDKSGRFEWRHASVVRPTEPDEEGPF